MAKVKLDLQNKRDAQLLSFAREHQTAMAGNPRYPDPKPEPAVLEAVVAEFAKQMAEVGNLETQLLTLKSSREVTRLSLERLLTERGNYVDSSSGGSETAILSAGFDTRAAAIPTTSLAAPEGLVTELGRNPGEIEVRCDPVPKAKAYVVSYRLQSGTADSEWQQGKMTTRSSTKVSGLVSGQRYSFRMRGLGANEIESPWSNESICMAP